MAVERSGTLKLTEPIERLLADSKHGTQLQIRLALLEHEALWSIHTETRESLATLYRHAIQEFLLRRGALSARQLKELRAVHKPRRSARESIV